MRLKLAIPDRRLWLPGPNRPTSREVAELLAGPGFAGRRRCCCSSGSGGYPCGTCTIPRASLTVSWTNLILGNGATSLVYSGGPTPQWSSPCVNQLLYELVCTENQIEFRVYYFVSGSCPTGQSQYCSTIRSNPFGIVTDSLTCSPSFDWRMHITSSTCPNLASNGYTTFEVN